MLKRKEDVIFFPTGKFCDASYKAINCIVATDRSNYICALQNKSIESNGKRGKNKLIIKNKSISFYFDFYTHCEGARHDFGEADGCTLPSCLPVESSRGPLYVSLRRPSVEYCRVFSTPTGLTGCPSSSSQPAIPAPQSATSEQMFTCEVGWTRRKR